MYMGAALKKKNAVYLCIQAHFEPSKTHYACMADSGFFLDYESGPQPPRFPEYGGEETSFLRCHFIVLIKAERLPRQARDKHRKSWWKKRHSISAGYHTGMVWAYEHMNSSAGVQKECQAHYGALGEGWRCNFAQYTASFNKAPLFARQSTYDSWQSGNVLHSSVSAIALLPITFSAAGHAVVFRERYY
jgi:hypothetical protein